MSPVTASPALRRDTERGLVGGVMAGLGTRVGVDPVVLRVAFVVTSIATSGLTLLAYLVAWAALPTKDGKGVPNDATGATWLGHGRSDWRVAAGIGLLTLSALLAFRELGIWWSDALVWPLVLSAFGVALLWGRFRKTGRASAPYEVSPSSRFAELYSGVFGISLVAGAGLLFLSSNQVLGGLRDVALTTVVVIVALALILAPFLWRLGRSLATERAERVRSQERAEVAAHLHDSVLQTLTLMQKRAGDPREVVALARRQERELRQWLSDDGSGVSGSSLAKALRSLAEATEDDHRVAVEVVTVGDCQIDPGTEPLLGATGEALANAARHAAGSGPIRLYAEMSEDEIAVFVRDRGPGFSLAAVPAHRRGVRESIVARMERSGGQAKVGPSPGGGTEVALKLPRATKPAQGGR